MKRNIFFFLLVSIGFNAMNLCSAQRTLPFKKLTGLADKIYGLIPKNNKDILGDASAPEDKIYGAVLLINGVEYHGETIRVTKGDVLRMEYLAITKSGVRLPYSCRFSAPSCFSPQIPFVAIDGYYYYTDSWGNRILLATGGVYPNEQIFTVNCDWNPANLGNVDFTITAFGLPLQSGIGTPSFNVSVVISPTLFMNLVSGDEDNNIFPNPANDRISFKYNNKDIKSKRINALILDDNNIIVKRFNLDEEFKEGNSFTNSEISLDVRDIPSGIYYLHIFNGYETRKRRLEIRR